MKSANALAAAALAAVLALPIAVHAQPASTPAPGTAAAPPAHATATPGPASPLSPAPAAGATAAERVEAHIRQLHDQLQITPAEKVQWDKFAAVMRANARAMDRDFAEREQNFASMRRRGRRPTRKPPAATPDTKPEPACRLRPRRLLRVGAVGCRHGGAGRPGRDRLGVGSAATAR